MPGEADLNNRDPNGLNGHVTRTSQPAVTMSVDLINRDPNNLNDHIRAQFEDVFAEPDGTHSIDCVWKLAFTLYNCCKGFWYKLATFFCGCFIAMGWGCEFAFVSLNHVWCVTPFMKMCAIECGTWQKFWATCCNCCIAPICESCGYYWSKINITHIKK